MTTDSITNKASTVAISACVRLAWRLIRTGGQWASKLDNSVLYVQPAWTLCKRIENLGLALEAWVDRIGRRLGVLDAALERVSGYAV